MKVAKKLRRESHLLRDFLTLTDEELSNRESVRMPKDMEAEIKWIKVRLSLP